MTALVKRKSYKRDEIHPYLSGNFAPVKTVLPLTPCIYTGSIPSELAGGQYVRNGGNPLSDGDPDRDAHWFDGDGMLSGVLFRRHGEDGTTIRPEFVNQFILTDVYLAGKKSPHLKLPFLPSITTLINPINSWIAITLVILRTVLLVILSRLPGSRQAVKRISVANTGVLYHDGRALATCESGPPIRVLLPGLETVGWFNGRRAEGEPTKDSRTGYGGDGLLGFMKEWTTGHPRVDSETSELITFHSTFAAPYVHYSVVPPSQTSGAGNVNQKNSTALLNIPVPGISSPKLMHDFGVSSNHTVIMDLPLSMNPFNLAKGRSVVSYDPSAKSRFGVFPRHEPAHVRWFETNPCLVFHTANCWETVEKSPYDGTMEITVHLLGCRLTSASVIYSAGNLSTPKASNPIPEVYEESEQCCLYYWAFDLSTSSDGRSPENRISHQWALSRLALEFPSLAPSVAMHSARYIYACTNHASTFGADLNRNIKIDTLVKLDVKTLIARGRAASPEHVKGSVDDRSLEEILASTDPADPIKAFAMPPGWYAQESRFVPRDGAVDEDDGWLLTYAFDDHQLDASGSCPPGAVSELWIIDARNMRDVVARVRLPQRVPYGLHGNWFPESEVLGQRDVATVRTIVDDAPLLEADEEAKTNRAAGSRPWRAWMQIRDVLERALG